MFNLGIKPIDMALMGQSAEHWVGINCGIMDQFSSVMGLENKVIKIDCRTLDYTYHDANFVDYSLIIFNSFFKLILIAPFLLFGLKLAFNTNDFLLEKFGYASSSLTTTQTLILYTISLSILNDFMTYVIHLLFHKIPFLWEFHKIHHSATSMNPFTQYRLHPIELLANNIKGILFFFKYGHASR